MGAPKLSAAERTTINLDNMRFSAYILIILSAIVVGIAIYRVTIYSVRYIRTLICLNDDRQQFFKLPNHTFGWIKRYIIYAPLFNRRHSKQMRMGPVELGVLPTRFQSMLLTGIIAMNVTLCVYGIEWNGPLNVKLWHLRNRSGTLSVVNMIPLVLMAGRNNPLIGLLNVSFNTFNLLHRWFGRIVVTLAVTHGVVEIIDMITGATAGKKVHPSGITIFTQSLQEARFLLWGFVATVAMITIILTSFTSFRHAFYETFLHIHIALVSLTLAGLWIHLKGLQQINHLKAVIAIWVAERIIRFFSLVYRNIGRTITTADIEALPGDAMRITLRLTRPVRFKPGQYIFLTIPSVGLWTSHPFSIAWFVMVLFISFPSRTSSLALIKLSAGFEPYLGLNIHSFIGVKGSPRNHAGPNPPTNPKSPKTWKKPTQHPPPTINTQRLTSSAPKQQSRSSSVRHIPNSCPPDLRDNFHEYSLASSPINIRPLLTGSKTPKHTTFLIAVP